jgi:hypothetical protein
MSHCSTRSKCHSPELTIGDEVGSGLTCEPIDEGYAFRITDDKTLKDATTVESSSGTQMRALSTISRPWNARSDDSVQTIRLVRSVCHTRSYLFA